ncbi:MAG: hypothetical protein ACOZF0_09070 [Thermodesulfobacteriota bacterium]
MDNRGVSSDNGGRRSNLERRVVACWDYSPERRTDNDRRSGFDRRKNRYENVGEIERRSLADIL